MAPRVHHLLAAYERRARMIPDAVLRAHALEKLANQRFHAQTAATLATLAPPDLRGVATEAIVAVEVMYDYLDALTEQPVPDPLASGRQLFRCFIDALALSTAPIGDYYALYPRSDDGGYLRLLTLDARRAITCLPAGPAIRSVATQCARRFAEAQIRAHAVPQLGDTQLREWSAAEAGDTGLDWLDYFAGATSSVVSLHAMLAAAASADVGPEHAALIDAFYLRLGVIVTMLDSLVDYDCDIVAFGEPGYVRYYERPDIALQRLPEAVRAAVAISAQIPQRGHHVMTLVGAIAFYTSATSARSTIARATCQRLESELRPLIWPTLATIRTWRLAKNLRRLFTRGLPRSFTPVAAASFKPDGGGASTRMYRPAERWGRGVHAGARGR